MTEARLDAELVRRGLARSRALAVAAIEEGRVQVDGRAVAKPATRVGADAVLTIDGRWADVGPGTGSESGSSSAAEPPSTYAYPAALP